MSSERQEEIRFLLQEHGNLTVAELAKHFRVSEMTIRRDLKNLAALGFIQREHGRAVLPPATPNQGALFLTRLGEAEREKTLIGRAAAELVANGESIILDAGTTTLAIARALNQECVIITNSLPIAGTLGNRANMTVFITGGEVRGETYALVGPMARSALSGFNADKLFLGATGVSLERGLSTASMLESEVKQAMISAAREVILVAHSAKVGQTFYHTFAQWQQIHKLITDAKLPQKVSEHLKNKGIEVILV